jgi:hypothetical protein
LIRIFILHWIEIERHMAKAIFTIKTGSRYDDRREQYYHFPRTYLNQVSAAVGDCIIYYEPRRSEGGSGRQAYSRRQRSRMSSRIRIFPIISMRACRGISISTRRSLLSRAVNITKALSRRTTVPRTKVRLGAPCVQFPKQNSILFFAPDFPLNCKKAKMIWLTMPASARLK